jgi:cell division protein FtsZ
MGVVKATGEGRAIEAARNAINSPLLETTIDGASGVIFTVTGGPDLTLHEVQEAANVVYASVSEEANIIFGAIIDERVHGEVLITVIATGFDMAHQENKKQHASQQQQAVSATQQPKEATATAPAPAAEITKTASSEFKKLASDILDIPEFLRARQSK